MTMEEQTGSPRAFVQRLLPWVVAAGALVVYLVTLNPWLGLSTSSQPPLSSNSLQEFARLQGWTLQPALTQPVYWLLTYPVAWLPVKWAPLALNLLAVLCACLSLALLARSVSLLPHDRTEEQRVREKSPGALLSIRAAWLPPLLAAAVCGFTLSFWENATLASAEMLDLLMFAWLIRALLEYRLDGRQGWLSSAALVCGAAMANNWGMVGFFPLFLIALLWIKGLGFFDLGFLARMFFWGLAGLLFYLLLPIANAISSPLDITLWATLKANLGYQYQMLTALPLSKFMLFYADKPLWVLALPSLLPLLIMSIRWPSYFGDPSRLGVLLATFVFHFFHAVLLVVCLWVTLDPSFSPRQILPGAPLLPFYYLAALAVGYLSGYFLLVFGPRPLSRARVVITYPGFVAPAVKTIVWGLAVLTVYGLVARNWPAIRISNGPMLKQYAALTAEPLLPLKGAVLLSDDPRRLTLVQAYLAAQGRGRDFAFVQTGALALPDYFRFLQRQHPELWPGEIPPGVREIDDASKVRLMVKVASEMPVYYLHPSFGYYFEAFQPIPEGLVYRLNLYSTNSGLLIPPVSAEVLAKNDAFWTRVSQQALPPLIKAVTPANPTDKTGFAAKLVARVQLRDEPSRDVQVVAGFYSHALNARGIDLQRSATAQLPASDPPASNPQLKAAGDCFDTALKLAPANLSARANAACNLALRANTKQTIDPSKVTEELFAPYGSWDAMLGQNGMFDDPTFCLAQGKSFVQGSLVRQAATEVDRARQLAPDDLSARLWLAQVYVLARLPDEALKLTAEVLANKHRFGLDNTTPTEVLVVQAAAYLGKKEVSSAEAIFDRALAQSPKDDALMTAAAQLYISFGLFTNAVAMLDRQLQAFPDNRDALVNRGFACLQMKAFDQAIPSLTRVLTLRTNTEAEVNLYHHALFNRAIAFLQLNQLDQAKADYEALLKAKPDDFRYYFGLGEIAYRQKDVPAAISYYEGYLSYNTNDTPEVLSVRERVKELKGDAK